MTGEWSPRCESAACFADYERQVERILITPIPIAGAVVVERPRSSMGDRGRPRRAPNRSPSVMFVEAGNRFGSGEFRWRRCQLSLTQHARSRVEGLQYGPQLCPHNPLVLLAELI